jgi:hypothetical protein
VVKAAGCAAEKQISRKPLLRRRRMSVIWIAALSAAIQITHDVTQFSEYSVSRAQRVVNFAGELLSFPPEPKNPKALKLIYA